MELDEIEAVWMDERAEFSLAEMVRCSGLSENDLRELVDFGVLVPADPQAAEWTFAGEVAVTMQMAGRLHSDLELDPQALALALTLLGRIRELEAQVRALRAQLPRRSV
jgi:chaperone modulatory protein CbpM